jgi:hypothetical protein
VVPGPVGTGAENPAPRGFDPRTVLPVAQSLYRLKYRARAHRQIRTAAKSFEIGHFQCKMKQFFLSFFLPPTSLDFYLLVVRVEGYSCT